MDAYWTLLVAAALMAAAANGQSSPLPETSPDDESDSADDDSAKMAAQPQQDESTDSSSEELDVPPAQQNTNDVDKIKQEDAAMALLRSLMGNDADGLLDMSSSSSSDSDDDDSDDDGDIALGSASDVVARRQGDLDPEFQNGEKKDQISSGPIYVTAGDDSSSSDDNPLLLTQGGYQRPLPPNRFQQYRPQPSSPNTIPFSTRTTYAGALQNAFGQVPRQPFGSPFTGLPASEATVPNAQFGGLGLPFSPDPNWFPSRDQNGLPFFQTHGRNALPDSPIMFQGPPQFTQAQPYGIFSQGAASPFFTRGNFQGYSGLNSAQASPRPDYSAFFRNPSQPGSPFNPNFYSVEAGDNANVFNNPGMSLMTDYPGSENQSPFLPPYLGYPMIDSRVPFRNNNQGPNKPQGDQEGNEEKSKQDEQIDAASDKDDPRSVPFGTRLQKLEEGQEDLDGQKDVYLRYPMLEAGYGTEENLPNDDNTTDEVPKERNTAMRPFFPFYGRPAPFPMFPGPNSYRGAMNNERQRYQIDNPRNGNNDNETAEDGGAENGIPFSDRSGAQPRNPSFMAYPDGTQGVQGLPFFSPSGFEGGFNPFEPLPVFQGNSYPYSTPVNNDDSDKIPLCAQNGNDTICYEDKDYPRRELMYALNSDSLLLDRLALPLDPQQEEAGSFGSNSSSSGAGLCGAEVRRGFPLRATNVQGRWKVVVNVERAIAGGRFMQPVSTEICSGEGEPCSYTSQVKTTCVQKHSTQRLLAWSQEKGLHNDLFRLPVACSCQLVEEAAGA